MPGARRDPRECGRGGRARVLGVRCRRGGGGGAGCGSAVVGSRRGHLTRYTTAPDPTVPSAPPQATVHSRHRNFPSVVFAPSPRHQERAMRANDTTAEDMRVVLQEGLIMRQYRHQGLRASSSAVHGTGCFAEHGFATGQFVCDYFGDLVPRNIGTRGRDQVGEGIWGLNESYQVDPRRRCAHTAQEINKTCTPTGHARTRTRTPEFHTRCLQPRAGRAYDRPVDQPRV